MIDQKAIENQIKTKEFYPDQELWNESTLISKLNNILLKKDNPKSKTKLQNKYSRYMVLIHTDEPELRIKN